MNSKALIDMLAVFPDTLTASVQGLSDEDLRWKPEKKAWSILEVVCHLGDEEVEDFRLRLKLTLQDPAEPWPGIDPEGWATDRKYNERDLGESLTRFTEERNASMARTDAATLIARYRSRQVIYLLGAMDTDPDARSLDKNCQAMAQGRHRAERGRLFKAYMDRFFSPYNHQLVTVPGVGHSARRMFTSPEGLAALFD